MKLKFYHNSTLEIVLDNNDTLFICICFTKNHKLESLELTLYSNNEILYKRDEFDYLYNLDEFEAEMITDIMPSHKSYHISLRLIKDSCPVHMEINEIELDNTVLDFTDSKEEG